MTDSSDGIGKNRPNGNILLRDGCHFVFGGDVCDRGVGDLRVLQDITGLMQRYPHRVHVVMGNRDINKMRMRFELAQHTLDTSVGNVYWIPKVVNTGNTRAEKLKWVGFVVIHSCLFIYGVCLYLCLLILSHVYFVVIRLML